MMFAVHFVMPNADEGGDVVLKYTVHFIAPDADEDEDVKLVVMTYASRRTLMKTGHGAPRHAACRPLRRHEACQHTQPTFHLDRWARQTPMKTETRISPP